jgi:hypothetical protein
LLTNWEPSLDGKVFFLLTSPWWGKLVCRWENASGESHGTFSQKYNYDHTVYILEVRKLIREDRENGLS